MRALNVNVGGVWDTMWVAYFLRDKQLYIQSPSAFIIEPPTAEWTLTRADQVPPDELSDGTYQPAQPDLRAGSRRRPWWLIPSTTRVADQNAELSER